MKHLLKEGKISVLMPEGMGGGLTGEVHLIKHKNKKYVVRRCETIEKARYYELLSHTFEKKGFLPKFLGRHGKDVFYEYIEGRDLKENENSKIFEIIGRIMAEVNMVSVRKNKDVEFLRLLNELKTGKYIPSKKVSVARKRRGITAKPRALLTKKKMDEIKNIYFYLEKKLNPPRVYEITDPTPGNFRLKGRKLYLVDIESIKPKIKGYGISKFLSGWGDDPKRKISFLEGYRKIMNINFLTKEYLEFIDLNFMIQSLNFQAQTGKEVLASLEKLDKFLTKYNTINL